MIHIVDISNPNFEDHIEVVERTISEIGSSDIPSLIVFNKIDKYTFTAKAEDDLTPMTTENISK